MSLPAWAPVGSPFSIATTPFTTVAAIPPPSAPGAARLRAGRARPSAGADARSRRRTGPGRPRSGPDQPAVRELPRRREIAGQHAHRLLEGEGLALAHPVAEQQRSGGTSPSPGTRAHRSRRRLRAFGGARSMRQHVDRGVSFTSGLQEQLVHVLVESEVHHDLDRMACHRGLASSSTRRVVPAPLPVTAIEIRVVGSDADRWWPHHRPGTPCPAASWWLLPPPAERRTIGVGPQAVAVARSTGRARKLLPGRQIASNGR